MRRYSNKTMCIALLCFLLYALDTIWADEMKNYCVISKPLVLHTLPVHDRYGHYDSAEIFVDADNHIIVLCSSILRDNNGYKKKISLFVFDNKTWVNNTLVLPGLPVWHGMVNNGVFQAYTTSNPPTKEPHEMQIISIYSLGPDMKLSVEPSQVIQMDKSQKAFKGETRRHIRRLLPIINNDPNKFFILGKYYESKLNVGTIIGYVISGGHGAAASRLFAALVDGSRVLSYRNLIEKVKPEEHVGATRAVSTGNKIHAVWLKYRAYSNAPEAVQHASFHLGSRQWTKPVELFRGYKSSEKMFDGFSPPSLTCNKESVYCTWSWTVIDATKNNRPIRAEESGIYFCSKMNEQWDKPVKIADLGAQPQVIVDSDGAIHVFWIERDKGLFYKTKTDRGWSDTCLVIKDRTIRVKETGLPGSPALPLSIAVDQNNNLHIIYIRDSTGGRFTGNKFKPEELVYIKLIANQRPASSR